MMEWTAAVITVSDKGSRGERVDTSGPALQEMLKEAGYQVVYTKIIPDEYDQIADELRYCSDDLKVCLALTTGGTGFSPGYHPGGHPVGDPAGDQRHPGGHAGL